jgi:hypothetical protein
MRLPPGPLRQKRDYPEAEKRLNNVPSFVRPMAKRAVEGLARKKGLKVIDEALMDEAKGKFMGGG